MSVLPPMLTPYPLCCPPVLPSLCCPPIRPAPCTPPSQDLEDVRSTMGALDDMRGAEIAMDMELQPIEECYSFLARCGVSVHREEMDRVDSLRYTFKNLQSQAVSCPLLPPQWSLYNPPPHPPGFSTSTPRVHSTTVQEQPTGVCSSLQE